MSAAIAEHECLPQSLTPVKNKKKRKTKAKKQAKKNGQGNELGPREETPHHDTSNGPNHGKASRLGNVLNYAHTDWSREVSSSPCAPDHHLVDHHNTSSLYSGCVDSTRVITVSTGIQTDYHLQYNRGYCIHDHGEVFPAPYRHQSDVYLDNFNRDLFVVDGSKTRSRSALHEWMVAPDSNITRAATRLRPEAPEFIPAVVREYEPVREPENLQIVKGRY
ncbi:hypothetical protein AJ80_06869 [Polytolypa hystricis UAMH7299]|uniref:Uncharacterized protein n=1 Tax=Polytolypa hystricis (strain UAMH7299) TaxID=1447883 RepID=A0A2B7XST5_POLH7|nr:hypothetical protein AJ80_06869 [Polytolypa hystricis UAMH7299]